ncbi:MAG: HAMP domain-containing sensor histidine kinase [Parvularculaceae bacterium]
MRSRPVMAFRLSSMFDAFSGRRAPQWRAGEGDLVLRLAPDGEILAATRAAADALAGGLGGGDIDSRSFFDFVSREDRTALKDALLVARHKAADAAALRLNVRLLRPGKPATFAELLFARDGGDLSLLIRDLGPELAERRRQADAPAAAEEIAPEHADAGKDGTALLADLGHEMKTPLNAIIGFAEAMREESFGPIGHPKYAEYAGHIHSSGLHLAELVSAMLDRGRLDAGRYALSPALADPAPVARAAAEMLRGEAEKAGLSYKVEIAEGLSETMFDAKAVRQILINLLSNAVKFTAAGEVALAVSERDGAIEFAVSDTGVGMSQTALARLGERFTALHKSGVRGAGGAGLGLSLAFSLAKLHGGALDLSSAPGEGARAVFRLPVRKSLAEMDEAGLAPRGDIQSQLDRVAQFRRERAAADKGRSAA